MSSTITRSQTSTYTEPRARYVMQKAFDDIVGLMSHKIIDKDKALKWYEELKYIIDLQAMKAFEFKVKANGVVIKAWRYDVSSDGSLLEDSESGGINLYDVPAGASASVVVDLTNDAGKEKAALDYLHSKGWGDGTFYVGTSKQDRAYSMEGFGLRRTVYEVTK